MTFGGLPVGAWFRTVTDPSVARVKTDYRRWKLAYDGGYPAFANRYPPDREVIRIESFIEDREDEENRP